MATLTAVVLRGPDVAVDGLERWRVVDLCRVVEERWGVNHCETRMAAVVARPVAPQDPSASPEDRQPGVRHLRKGGFAARLLIAEARPEAERLEIRGQDEVRVEQQDRSGYVWWSAAWFKTFFASVT